MIPAIPTTDRALFRAAVRRLGPLAAYHRFTLHGVEHIPASGRALLLCHHSPVTYDLALLLAEIQRRTGRNTRALADRIFFRWPRVGRTFERLGAVSASPEASRALLEAGELVALAPGGMREALRPSSRRHQIRWDGRRGFAKVALETQSPVLLYVCPRADLIYTLYESPATEWLYQRYRLPLVFPRGWGLSLVPRPVRLDAYLSAPIRPPPLTDVSEPAVDAFRAQLLEQMIAFSAACVARDCTRA